MGGDRTLHLDTILGSEGGRIKLSQCARPRQRSGLDAASLTALRPIAYEMKSPPFAPWCLDIHIAVRRLDAVLDCLSSGLSGQWRQSRHRPPCGTGQGSWRVPNWGSRERRRAAVLH